jgi:DNA polymerase III subunit epsilon
VEAVREPLCSTLHDRFLLTWSAGVEIGFLSGLYGGSHRWWRRRTVDVMRLAIALERADRAGPHGDYQLASVAARYGVPVESPHHALGDALMTAELFMVMATKLAGHGYRAVRHLLRETKGIGRW